jgi:hypothetical protein
MATSAAAIAAALKPAIKAAMVAAVAPCNFNMTGGWVDCYVDALAEGIGAGLYPELQNLEDTAGTPASPTHQ